MSTNPLDDARQVIRSDVGLIQAAGPTVSNHEALGAVLAWVTEG